MPSFTVETTCAVDVDFEVFCERCGAGLCNQSSTGSTSRRRSPYVRVEPCDKCLENEFEKGADSRDGELDDLRDKIRDLETRLQTAERYLEDERNG